MSVSYNIVTYIAAMCVQCMYASYVHIGRNTGVRNTK